MGIAGLTSYLERSDGSHLKEWRVRGCRVVVDGSGLAARLFATARRRDAFGGDYGELAALTALFFGSLEACGARPLVVCDGGLPRRKLRTAGRRLAAKARASVAPGPPDPLRGDVFPPMLRDLLFETMRDSGVDFYVADGEADGEIAAVARRLAAPVLGYDSDFYAYGVAYIPIDKLRLDPTQDPDGPYLRCDRFVPENFLTAYGLRPELLPLMATLLGNDIVRRSTFARFFRALLVDEPRFRKKGRIGGLISWLRDETIDSAVETVLACYPPRSRRRLLELIERSCRSYAKPTGIAEEGEEDDEDDDEEPDSDRESELAVKTAAAIDRREKRRLPRWLSSLLETGRVSPKFHDLLGAKMWIGWPQLEDAKLPDAAIPSLSILRYSYDLMTGFGNSDEISYIGRRGTGVFVTKVCRLIEAPDQPIDLEDQPDPELFRRFVAESLSVAVAEAVETALPGSALTLLAAAWLRARHDVPFDDVHALAIIVHSIMATLIRKKPQNLPSDIPRKHCSEVNIALSKYFNTDKRTLTDKKMYNKTVLHGFSQFQACFQQFYYLNALLSYPIYSPTIGDCYNGTFVYNLYADLKKRKDPRVHLATLLKKAPSVLLYIENLMKILDDAFIAGIQERTKYYSIPSALLKQSINVFSRVIPTILAVIIILYIIYKVMYLCYK